MIKRPLLITLIILAGLIAISVNVTAANDFVPDGTLEMGASGYADYPSAGTPWVRVAWGVNHAPDISCAGVQAVTGGDYGSGLWAGYSTYNLPDWDSKWSTFMGQNINLYQHNTITMTVRSTNTILYPNIFFWTDAAEASANPTTPDITAVLHPPVEGFQANVKQTWTYDIPDSIKENNQNYFMAIGGGAGNPVQATFYYDDILVDGVAYISTPTANFTATPVSGSKPLQVSFTDTSSNIPTSWLWDFGDGVTSTAQNPIHVYNNTGIYNVSHYAANSAGSDWENKTGYITVTQQAGTFSGYFELTGAYSYDQGWPSVSFNAILNETDPLDQYDQIVWYLDGARISNADISGSWVQYVELKKNGANWQYFNPNTYSWTTTATPLQNKYHFHTTGSHVIRAMVLYQNVTVSDVSLTINVNQLGLYSEKVIVVRNSAGALIQGSTVGYYDMATGDTNNLTLPTGVLNCVLISGHNYRFTISADGYTTKNEDRAWNSETSQYPPFILYNESVAPIDPNNIYVHVSLKTNSDQYGLSNPISYGHITLTSATEYYPYQVDVNGLREIIVPKNTYFTYVATASGYETVSGSFVTGTTNYELNIILPYIRPAITPTPAPYTPTAKPTTKTGGTMPGYPEYDDTERTNIINGGIDQWIGALPGLIDLVILVCICTLIGMISTGLSPKKRR